MTTVQSPSLPPVLAFGGFEIDSEGHVFDRQGHAVGLSRSQRAVLVALVRAGGGLIPHTGLVACGWPGGRATYASLARCICTLRQLLRAAGSGGQLIETVHRRGYRLAVPVVRRLTSEAGANEAPPRQATPPRLTLGVERRNGQEW